MNGDTACGVDAGFLPALSALPTGNFPVRSCRLCLDSGLSMFRMEAPPCRRESFRTDAIGCKRECPSLPSPQIEYRTAYSNAPASFARCDKCELAYPLVYGHESICHWGCSSLPSEYSLRCFFERRVGRLWNPPHSVQDRQLLISRATAKMCLLFAV